MQYRRAGYFLDRGVDVRHLSSAELRDLLAG